MTRYINQNKHPLVFHQEDTVPVLTLSSATVQKQQLFAIFDELDAIILDEMPESLLIPPAQLIKEEYYRICGESITLEEILQGYVCYEQTCSSIPDSDNWNEGGNCYD